ncbi:hypothetical protein MPER_14713, partial [Moniliophthora perniciosa FA553]
AHVLIPAVELVIESDGIYHRKTVLKVLSLICPVAFVWLAGTLPLRAEEPGNMVAKSHDVPSVAQTCPEDGVNLWSWSTFSFVEPIFAIATKRTLNDSDVWRLSPFFGHKNLFNKCLEYRARHPKHSLLRFLLTSNSLDLILDVVLELWSA